MNLETPRLLVRDFRMEDASDLYEILGDAETMKDCEPPYDFQKTEQFLSQFCIARGRAVGAVHKQSGKMIGYILFSESQPGVYEMGWFFNRKYWRQGYAYEACRAVIDYVFTNLNVHKIFSETIDPVKSAALMRKLGMKPEGVQKAQVRAPGGSWADLYVYGLLKEEQNAHCVPANLSIRCAIASDYPGVESIMQEVQQLHVAWRPDIYKAADTVYTRDYFEHLIAEKRLLVAQMDGIVVGLLSFMYRHVASDKQVTRDVILVDDLVVKAEYRGHGIGTQLLNQMKEKVHSEHLDGLELQVNAKNTAARKMYETFGFTEKSINLELL